MVCNAKQNPGYMKENFMICIESLHIADTGEQDNVRKQFEQFFKCDV